MVEKKPSVYYKEGVVLNASFKNNSGKQDSVIFFDQTCIIIGAKNKMHTIAVHPGFDPNSLPELFRVDFFKIPNVNLFMTTQFSDPLASKYNIPDWLTKMPNLSYIKFENIKLDRLSFLDNLELKQLVLTNVELIDRKDVVNIISKIKTLDYLVSDNIFNPDEVVFLKQQLPNLTFLSEAVYNKKIAEGEINYPIK